jgi:hypothetical protein
MSTVGYKKIAALACASLAAHSAQAAQGSPLPFVTCPIVQDTPSVPCWIANYRGETYYLGIQSDVSAPFNPPSLGHKVLVEGSVKKDAPRICGGLVVDPRYVLPFEPPRPPGPSTGKLAFSYPAPPPPAQPPYKPMSFTVPYEFEGMVNFMTPRVLTPALKYAQLVKAKRIEIVGYRGETRLSDGTVLVEHEGIARARADEIASMLRGAGIDRAQYVINAEERPAPGGPEERRTVITVVP